MHIKYVKLENIRSYVNEKVDFPSGSVLLCGDIGSGKSTILLAIEFALFGIKRGSYSGSSLLRNGAKKGTVEMKFYIESGEIKKEVVISRSLSRTNTSVKQDAGFLIVNGERKEGTPIELRSWVLDLLGYPNVLLSKSKDLIYRYTVYTPQEDMKQILFSDKEERLDTLRRVFNIDKYKRIRDNLGIVTKKIKENSKELEGRIFSLPDKTKQYKEIIKEANEITREIKELVPKITLISKDLEKSKSDVDSFQESVMKLRDLKSNFESKEKEVKNLDMQKKSFEQDIKRIDEFLQKTTAKINSMNIDNITEDFVSGKENELEKLQESVTKMMTDNELLQEKIKSLKENISVLSKETKSKKESEKLVLEKRQELKNIAIIINQKKEFEKNIEKLEKIIEKLHNRITELGVNFANSNRTIDEISNLSDCPTCHQKVEADYKKRIIKDEKEKIKTITLTKTESETSLRSYEERLAKTKENLKLVIEKEKEHDKVTMELENLENSFKEFDAKRQRIKEMEEKIEFFSGKIISVDDMKVQKALFSEKKNEFKEIQRKYSLVREKRVLLSNIEEKKQSKQEILLKIKAIDENSLIFAEDIKVIGKDIAKFSDSEKKLDAAKKLLDSKQTELKDLEMKKASLLSKRDTLVKSKDSIEVEIVEMRKFKERIFYLGELRNWLEDYFAKLTVFIEKNIMMRVYGEFNELFKEWFNMMIEDETLNVRLDEEFTPVVEQNGYEVSLEDLSGGEKTSCALAYRLALNKVINDCIDSIKTNDLIILDEPTDGFSSEQLDRLKEVLDEIKIGQIIVVSHETKIESFVDNIIRINKSEHISSIV